jgi:aminoglycoside phosphotransferase (APT) family kinase protein
MAGAPDANPLSEEQLARAIAAMSPGASPVSVKPLPGSYSNFTNLVEALAADGSVVKLVVRRYAAFGHYDLGEKARREYRTLELLKRHGLPVPEPLLLDQRGDLLGTPGIISAYVSGVHDESPPDPEQWARALAHVLAQIHALSCEEQSEPFLLDANTEATWFLRSPSLPDYMAAHPHGPEVWQALCEASGHRAAVPARLVHLDYWPGNVLWRNDQIMAVVDWEEAACGDPAIDVAYCRMELVLRGLDGPAELFLESYESRAGRRVENPAFWELAAVVRPMASPAGWIDDEATASRFSRFIEDAHARLSSAL